MPSPRVICAAGALIALALPATAQAEPAAQLAASRLTVKPGATATISVRVHATSSCALRVRRRAASVDTSGAASVAFSFRIAARTGVRRARATIACAPLAPQTVALRVAPKRPGARGGRLIAGRIRASVTAEGATGAEAESAARARAQAEWDAGEDEWMKLWRNGQCTDWVQRKRPDIVERATVARWTDERLGRPVTTLNWNGGFWDETAAVYGLEVGSEPRVGAVVTFDPGVMGAGAGHGHAAYVESVGETSFRVSEMNAPELGRVTERTIRIADLPSQGVAFIY